MENHGQKIEYGEEFYTINNYNDVLSSTKIEFRQMDLAEELLAIWWLLQFTFTLLWYWSFYAKEYMNGVAWKSIKSLGLCLQASQDVAEPTLSL